MSDAAVVSFDSFQDVTLDDVNDAKRHSLLERGYYSGAITKVTPKVSRSGQAMLMVGFSPCRTPGDPKTQSFKHKLTYFLMLPWLQDREALRATIATKRDLDPARISNEDVDEEWGNRRARAIDTFVADVRTLLGEARDRVPLRKALVQSGQVSSYDEAAVASLNAAKEAVQAIANGNINLEGHTKAIYVTEGQFNGEPCNNIANIKDNIPQGYAFLPVF